ncbi:MAG: PedC/BrcD family bacteriocin maturation disulfide isomerase [Liquorilactobacillus ghanensis]|uniref:PedC/BrcD family bacteriocin maturation disulfide isomerase n=1 Tax=Liquorilactobacillus ghanensis TaxID=399370 RepID=UPI0039EB0CB8
MNLKAHKTYFFFFILFFVGIIVLFLQTPDIQASVNNQLTSQQNKTQNQYLVSQDEYEENIKKTIPISTTELITKFNSEETFVLFIGYKECKYCRAFSPTLNSFMNTSTISIYYLDVDSVSQSELTQSFIDIMDNKIKLQGTPTIVLIKHSKVIHEYIGSNIPLNQLQTLKKYKYAN